MAMVNLCCRLVSCYGKNRLGSRTTNAILFTRHDHILKGNVKPEPLNGLLSCCIQNISSRATSNEKDELLQNAANMKGDSSGKGVSKKGSKKGVSNKKVVIRNKVHTDVDFQDASKFAVEEHNRENDTKLKFVEVGNFRLSALRQVSEHVTQLSLILKVIDEEGKVEYVLAYVNSRRGSLEAAPLVYLTNSMLRSRNTSISECFSDDNVQCCAAGAVWQVQMKRTKL